ncbi:GGDEF domain-containing protein [Aliivibrio finisterrensis]|uniref:diguanylate cyclase n=1 Tax=Aliivibrio finisterrensis TaxID=511998 RepID=A0A4Q5KY32_9GAMM|nr:GGDEF domain-containing protein [Aliivibrio finisterrensis]
MKNIYFFKRYKVHLFPAIFIGVFSSLLYFNVFSISILDKNIKIKYQEVVDLTKRFHGYYINANEIQLDGGVHEIDDVGIIVNKKGTVKVLSPAIALLRQSLETVIDKKYIWTVAVIEKLNDEDTGNSYFKPLRKNYIKFNDKSLHDSLMLDRIIELENLAENYKGFHSDDIKVTEVYKEEWTNKLIHSIIYPIYLDRKLVSVIIVDVKEGWINGLISNFNNKEWLFIKGGKGLDIFTFDIVLPYSSNNAIYPVSIDISNMFISSLYLSTIINFAVYFLYICFSRIKNKLRYDVMTKLYRRDYYESKLEQLDSAYVLMIDIDHFKQVNDTYGHDVGDCVIKQVSERIRAHIRANDIAIRWGGEEFMIIFPYMHMKDFFNKAEKLRQCIESELIENMLITISIGGVEKKDSELMVEAIERADMALYQSKNAGRNRVTIEQGQYET